MLNKYAQVLGTLLEVGVGFEDSVGLAVLKRSSVEKFNVEVGMRVWAGGSWGVLEEVRSVTGSLNIFRPKLIASLETARYEWYRNR